MVKEFLKFSQNFGNEFCWNDLLGEHLQDILREKNVFVTTLPAGVRSDQRDRFPPQPRRGEAF